MNAKARNPIMCATCVYVGAIRRWGKKAAGRELDGRTHDAYPAVTS